MNREYIDTLRALVTAANSLRYNPDIDPDAACFYESKLFAVKSKLEENPDLLFELIKRRAE